MSRGSYFGVEALLWIFYLVLTAVIIVAFVVVPAGLIDKGVATKDIEAVILGERALSKAQAFSASVGSLDVFGGLSNASFGIVANTNASGIRVTSGSNVFFVNKAYFEHSEWLVPFSVSKYERSRVIGGVPVRVEVLLDKGDG